jgi:AraC-like DNA-binding protein
MKPAGVTTKSVPTVSATLPKAVIALAAARGIPAPALLAAVGLSLEQLADTDATVPFSVHLELWRRAGALSGDESFGLHLAESIPKGMFGINEYIFRNSPDLEAALRALARYRRLVAPDEWRLAYEPTSVRFEVHVLRSVAPLPRHTAEFMIASMVRKVQDILGEPVPPREVWLAHAAPADVREHARVFSCPVHFERPVYALVLDRALLSRPVIDADAALKDLLVKQADAILERLGERVDLVNQVHRAICTEMKGEVPTLSRVARLLGLSTRNLQRQLQQNGTSFNRLLDETCSEIARYQVRQQRLPIGEVAFLLGYSEVSAFHRAFRRWTRMSPAQYRSLP